MPAATRQSDCCTGHDACPPVPLVECSPNVIINGLGAGRVGDHATTMPLMGVLPIPATRT